ncbi:MAG TPA: hypothetical protein ENK57_15880 [Polyangiaceae bacterium]|nr:hypothetical protein [Polyangiaceae bacterium]
MAIPTHLHDARDHAQLLVHLLDDDSDVVLQQVRRAFARLGRRGLPALRAATRSESPRVRGRARELLLREDRRRAVRRLVRYAARGARDLETGLFLLDAHGAPGEDLRGYRSVLDSFADEVRRRTRALPARLQALELARYLGEEVGFAGSSEAFHHPDNIYLHRAIDRREGMPLTLCAIYAFVARRAGLAAELLPFPGHVLLAVGPSGEGTILDPFGGGAVVSREGCLKYLAEHGLPYRREFFHGASDSSLFLRHVVNLIHSCRLRHRDREALDLELVLRALTGSPRKEVR